MKLLITGSAGFIGARTSQLALNAGHEVTGLDNMNDYYDTRLKSHRMEPLLKSPGFSFVEADIEDGAALDKLFLEHRFDAVINLAARAGVRASIETPHIYVTTNTTGTLNLLERVVRHGVPKFVLASTSSLYAGQPMPFNETALVTRPLSPYAATKLAAEALCYVWHHLYKVDITVVRYFTVYGPAGRPDMSPFRFCEWISRREPLILYGDGTQTRDFTYIDDIAGGTLAALKPLGYEIINIGGGNKPVAVNDMIRSMERHLDRKAVVDYKPFQGADMRDTSADISKATRLLGWTPVTPPDEGFRLTAEWHRREQSWLQNVIL